MTYQEAIKVLVNATYSDEWQGNEAVTTAQHMAVDALEKQIKMQHHHTAIKDVDGKGVYFRFSICPNCLGEIISYKNGKYPRYCNWCGQAIDWGDKE